MPDNKLDINQIKELMELVASTDMGELEIEKGDIKIRISAKTPAPTTVIANAAPVSNTVPVAPAVTADKAESSQPVETTGKQVKSPIVGTFYSAPSPDRSPFIKVGQTVKKGDVLFIVESMKLMNEIQSEFDGEVTEILCIDGQSVEYGQPIVILK